MDSSTARSGVRESKCSSPSCRCLAVVCNAAVRRDWVLDELSTAGRENLDPIHASRYDSKEDARAADEVNLLVSLGLDSAKNVIHLGAGTGQFVAGIWRFTSAGSRFG